MPDRPTGDLLSFEFTMLATADWVGPYDPPKIATKRCWLRDGRVEWEHYGGAQLWRFGPVAYRGFGHLADGLRWMATQPRLGMTLGAPAPGLFLGEEQFRIRATLVDVPRKMIVADIDGVDVPPDLSHPLVLPRAAMWIRDNLLPPVFHGAAGVVAPTSRTGFDGTKVRCRMFFSLARPAPLEDLRDWAQAKADEGFPLDAAVLRSAQLIATARPVFHDFPDPFPVHLHATVVDGFPHVDLGFGIDEDGVIVRPVLPPKPVKIRAGDIIGGTGTGGDWRGLALAEIGIPAGQDGRFYEPLIRVIGMAAKGSDSADAIAGFLTDLIGQRGGGYRAAKFNDDFIRRAIASLRQRDARTADRVQKNINRLIATGAAGRTKESTP